MMTLISLWLCPAMLAPIYEREIVNLFVAALLEPTQPGCIRFYVFLTVRTRDANCPFVQNKEKHAKCDANGDKIRNHRWKNILEHKHQNDKAAEDNHPIRGCS